MNEIRLKSDEAPREGLRKSVLIAVKVAEQAKDKAYEDIRYWDEQVNSKDYKSSARTKAMDKKRLHDAWSRWFGACDVYHAVKEHYEAVYE